MKLINLVSMATYKVKDMPKYIQYNGITFKFNEEAYWYYDNYEDMLPYSLGLLNEEVAVIENRYMCRNCGKYPAEYNQTECEFCLGISKKIKKLDTNHFHNRQRKLAQKINEIIDFIYGGNNE